jgi:hypothetical protein
MKKFLVTILAVFYLGTSVGATIQFHYCMGKLVDWGMEYGYDSKCSICGMEKKSHEGCCKDEYKQIKNDNAQKVSESYTQLKKITSEAAQINFPEYSFKLPDIVPNEFSKANAPPRSCRSSIYIINCVFLI